MRGYGSIDNPWDLATALAGPNGIQPGHTLWLRGGTYRGDFVSTLASTQAQPITIRPYGTEVPIIDGSLVVNGAYPIVEDLIIRYSGWTTRRTEQTGSNPTDLPIDKNFDVYAPGAVIRRCVIHDMAGIGFWIGATNAIYEDCVIFNQGWSAPDRGHGHCLYTQNQAVKKTIRRCVFVGGYSDYALHAYTEGSYVQNYDLTDCIWLGKNSIFQGGTHGIDGIVASGNIIYNGALGFGSGGSSNGSVSVADTEALGGATVNHAGSTFTSYTETGTNMTLGNRVLIRGRNVAICNQAGAASVAVDLSSMGLTLGSTYRLRNVQDYFGDVQAFVYDGSSISVPMTGHTVATPYAAPGPIMVSTFPSFGTFVVTA